MGDVTGSGSRGRRELNVWSKIRACKLLEEDWGASFGDPGSPVDDEVLSQSTLVMATRLERQGNTIVVSDVAHLAALRQVTGNDLITVKTDPDNRDLRAAI